MEYIRLGSSLIHKYYHTKLANLDSIEVAFYIFQECHCQRLLAAEREGGWEKHFCDVAIFSSCDWWCTEGTRSLCNVELLAYSKHL